VSQLSLTEKILVEKTVCVLLVRGQSSNGQAIYAYVAVKASQLEAFMRAQQNGTFYPEEHGVVIESGEGEPSDEVRARMEQEYGFDHQAMRDVPDADNAMRIAAQLSKPTSESSE
jgi:hypothetical protein